jgi:hypothetical protein
MYSFCSCFVNYENIPLRCASSIHSISIASKAPLRTILLILLITAMAVRSSSCLTTGPVYARRRIRYRSSASFMHKRYASSYCFLFARSMTLVHTVVNLDYFPVLGLFGRSCPPGKPPPDRGGRYASAPWGF